MDFLTVSGRYMYGVINGGSGSNYLEIWDVYVPTAPVYIGGSASVGHGASFMTQDGRYVYISCTLDQTVEVWDVGNVSSVTKAATISSVGTNPQRLAISGKFLYIASDNLYIYDITIPADPVSVASVPTGTINNIYIQGIYAYVIESGSNNLDIINLSTVSKSSTNNISTLGISPNPIVVSGRYAYIGGGIIGGKLGIYDISNPSTAVSIGTLTFDLPAFTQFQIAGKYLYAARDTDNAITVFDVSTPASPTEITSVTLGSRTDNIFVSGRYIYVSNYASSSFNIIEVPAINTPAIDAGSIATDQLSVLGNAQIENALLVRGSINVGFGGVAATGPLAGSSVSVGGTAMYYCSAGASAGNTCRGNGCSCSGGSWVLTGVYLK
jgi:hypothetical protein